jgi:HEPN domain-containing protein
MVQDKLNIASVKSFWMVEAQEALDVTEHLFEKGDYSYALFFGHLAIEKALKALYVVERKEHAPPIHNLTRLAKLAGISLDQDKLDKLILITSHLISKPDIQI